MTEVERARARWPEDKPKCEKLGELVAARLLREARSAGIPCETTARAKDLGGLIKKLLAKPKYTYESMPDKIGARCVVRYASDVEKVVEIAQGLFDCYEIDRKQELLKDREVGYASIHVQLRLKTDDPDVVHFDGLVVELQVRTLGQHLWAEMSHDAFYKNDEALNALPVPFRRRLNLMAGLIEVADQEFDRLNREQPQNVAVSAYRAMERHLFKLTDSHPNHDLSIQIIQALLPLYPDQSETTIVHQLNEFFDQHEPFLRTLYDQSDPALESPILYQPEALMIYERLAADAFAVREAWNAHFPEKELEAVATSFGFSFE